LRFAILAIVPVFSSSIVGLQEVLLRANTRLCSGENSMIVTKSQAIEDALWKLAFFFLLAFGLGIAGTAVYMLIVRALDGIFNLLMIAIILGWIVSVIAFYRSCFSKELPANNQSVSRGWKTVR
jgi:hypothetical protein